MPRDFSRRANRGAVLNTLPKRLVRSRPPGSIGSAALDVRLPGTQAKVHDALLATLLGTSTMLRADGSGPPREDSRPCRDGIPPCCVGMAGA